MAVLAGKPRRLRMIISAGLPGNRRMAAFADICRGQMVLCFACRCRAVVASKAVADHVDMVEARSGPTGEVGGGMAIRTHVRRRNVVYALAICRWSLAIVAGEAVRHIQRQVVIKTCGMPRHCGVTGRAVIVCFEMCCRASRGTTTIMTINTIGNIASLPVVKQHLRPAYSCVAGFTKV